MIIVARSVLDAEWLKKVWMWDAEWLKKVWMCWLYGVCSKSASCTIDAQTTRFAYSMVSASNGEYSTITNEFHVPS